MGDFGAGREAGARAEGSGPWDGGSPPPVLLAALGAALLIAVTLVALLTSGGGGDDVEPLPDGGTAGTQQAAPQRVLLTVSLEGSGRGRIRIAPGDVSCSRSCERRFTRGARLVATADASSGSTFEGWGDGCDDGGARCLFVMDGERSLTATFEDAAPQPPPADPLCADDPACADGGDEPAAGRLAPSSDCQDGRDNDGDGLTDAAQDPGCTERGSEAGGGAPPPAGTTAPAPPRGTTTAPAPPPAAASECRDGRDNDGDGLVDTAQDPGCEADRTEAG